MANEGAKRVVSSSVYFEEIGRFTHLINHRLADRYISVNWDVDELQAKKDAIIQGGLLKVRMRL